MNPLINFGNLKIDAYKYAIQGNILLGTRSAGKTTAGKFLAESLMDLNIPVIIIDPISKWRFMQEKNPNNPNGKSYPVIVVGKGGDVELSPETIENVVMIALKNRSSLVIDLFDADILEYWDEIVTTIVKTLLYKNEQYGLRHIIFEEASEFIHQYGKKTQSSEWIERLVRLSGNVKVGALFINQNSESISKAVVKLCDGRIIGRQTEKNSIDTIRKWLSGGGVENAAEVSETLPGLGAGQFWVWSTSDNKPVLNQFPDIKSLHPSRHDISYNDVKTPVDVNEVLSQMNFKEEITYIQPKPAFNAPIFTKEEKPVEIELPDIDILELTTYEKNIGYVAGKTPFANSNVRSTIDGLVKKGYTIYGEYPFQLRNPSNNKTFGLNSDIERKYAKLITKLVAQNT